MQYLIYVNTRYYAALARGSVDNKSTQLFYEKGMQTSIPDFPGSPFFHLDTFRLVSSFFKAFALNSGFKACLSNRAQMAEY